jgi:S1-C subfamily serine protease
MWTVLLGGAVVGSGLPAWGQGVLRRVEERVRELIGEQGGLLPPAERATGAVEPGYLGLVADDRQDQGQGVRVMEIVAGGPAEKAGLKEGDLIVAIGQRRVRTMDDMAQALEGLRAGSRATFEVRRGNASLQAEVTLVQRPAQGQRKFPEFGRIEPAAAQAPQRPRLGVRTQPLSEASRAQLQVESGVLVATVEADSPAEAAGVRPGAVLTKVDGEPVRSPDDLARKITAAPAGQEVELTWVFRGQERISRVLLSGQPTAGEGAFPPPPGPGELPPPPGAEEIRPGRSGAEPAVDETAIEALERRLQQLEDRLEKVERALEQQGKQ